MGLFASLTGTRSVQSTMTSKRTSDKSKYRGVEVNSNPALCCKEVQTIAGKRFLSHEIPKLPLLGCDANECRCSYELYEDRRTDVRRAGDVAFDLASELCEQNNRNSTGRRTDD